MNQSELWCLAQAWVKSNPVLISHIAAPYRKHMNCHIQDLTSEALLTSYQVLHALSHDGQDLSLMSRYFRVVFRTQCIKMTTRVNVVDYQIEKISAPIQRTEKLNQEVIKEILQTLTHRQRQISEWILSQPTPVSTSIVGQKFGINDRTVRVIINNAIKRIENYGHQSIRKTVQATA